MTPPDVTNSYTLICIVRSIVVITLTAVAGIGISYIPLAENDVLEFLYSTATVPFISNAHLRVFLDVSLLTAQPTGCDAFS